MNKTYLFVFLIIFSLIYLAPFQANAGDHRGLYIDRDCVDYGDCDGDGVYDIPIEVHVQYPDPEDPDDPEDPSEDPVDPPEDNIVPGVENPGPVVENPELFFEGSGCTLSAAAPLTNGFKSLGMLLVAALPLVSLFRRK